MADHQLRLIPEFQKAQPSLEDVGPTTDAVGSASAAAGFGVREFTNQDARRWEMVWHHNTGHDARAEHVDMDGVTAPADVGFDVDPGLGAPGCACYIEPINPSGSTSYGTLTLGDLTRMAKEFKGRLALEPKYHGTWTRNALRGFQTHSWDLQAALREGRKLTGLDKIGGLPANSRVRWLDEAIQQGQLADDTVLYRGVSEDLVRGMRVGDNLIDPAYGSTSISEGIARGFGDRMLEIHAGAGTNAAFLGDQFAKQSLGEILLGRGTRYEIKEILADRIVVEVQGVTKKVAERIAEKVTASAGKFKSVRECEAFINQTIRDARDIAEIPGDAWAETVLKFKGKNIGLDMANRLTQIAESIAKKAPEMWGRTGGFVMENRFDSGTYAWVQGFDKRIHLEISNWAGSTARELGLSGTRTLEELESAVLRDAANGFHPAGGLESIISHEMGHVYFGSTGTWSAREGYSGASTMMDMIGEAAQTMATQGFDSYVTEILADSPRLAKLVSRYAEKNFAEFGAEVTAAIISGEGERYVSNLLGKEFIKAMRAIYKKRGLIE
jgi:hypothetical protein